jgi:chromatin remodeling complex protein RSC6
MPPTPAKKQPVVVAPIQESTPPPADAQSKKKKVVSAPVATVPATTPAATVPVVLTVTPVAASATATAAAPAQDSQHPVAEPVTENVLSTIIDKVNTLSSAIKDIQASLKVLSKEYDKQLKIIEKAQKKRQNAKNSPSGFAKPNKISDELCDFIGVPHGTEKSRTDITRLINAYVKEHKLNKPENKRFILPDTKLKKILNVGDSEEINYFILQRLISHHFPASASKTVAKPTTA